jgi:transposase, IS30 family
MYHRVGFTAAQSAELWERWKKGEGLKSIGRAFGKPSAVAWQLAMTTGSELSCFRSARLDQAMASR